MYYFWGYLRFPKDSKWAGKCTALLSTKNPDKSLSLEYKDWRLAQRDFDHSQEAVAYGKRLILRYRKLKSARSR